MGVTGQEGGLLGSDGLRQLGMVSLAVALQRPTCMAVSVVMVGVVISIVFIYVSYTCTFVILQHNFTFATSFH